VNPLVYQRLSDDSVAVFASKGGAPTNPDWFHNIVANPKVKAEIGGDTVDLTARIAEPDERERIWSKQKQDYPGFAEYEDKTKDIRTIPVVILEPA
jgi:deazaflavin-dependent oxidoreductase (nitroreductase family)